MRRKNVIAFDAKLPECATVMKACCSAHHRGRALATLGHTVRPMPPEYVRPCVNAHENDDCDAEPAARPAMRFVVITREGQLELEPCIERATNWSAGAWR